MDLILSIALSTHLGLVSDLNEIHPHVRLHKSNTIVGVYQNSNGDAAFYGGFIHEKNNFFVEYGIGIWKNSKGDYVNPFGRAGYRFNKNIDVWIAPAVEYLDNDTENVGAVAGIEFKI